MSIRPARSRFWWLPRARKRSAGVRCSFCHKDQAAVQKIIAGPNAYICNECVDLCRDIIVEELGPIERLPATVQGTVSVGLQALTHQAKQLAQDIEGLAQFVESDPETGPDAGVPQS